MVFLHLEIKILQISHYTVIGSMMTKQIERFQCTQHDKLRIHKDLMNYFSNRLKLFLNSYRFVSVSLFSTHKMQSFLIKRLILLKKIVNTIYVYIHMGFFSFNSFRFPCLIAIYQVGLCCTIFSKLFVLTLCLCKSVV